MVLLEFMATWPTVQGFDVRNTRCWRPMCRRGYKLAGYTTARLVAPARRKVYPVSHEKVDRRHIPCRLGPCLHVLRPSRRSTRLRQDQGRRDGPFADYAYPAHAHRPL